jgi:hypothetical protein
MCHMKSLLPSLAIESNGERSATVEIQRPPHAAHTTRVSIGAMSPR